MNVDEYICLFNDIQYDLHISKFNTPIDPTCITVSSNADRIQTFLYSQQSKIVISYTTDNLPEELKRVFYEFLQYMKFPVPAGMSYPTLLQPILFQKTRASLTSGTIIFSTNTYTFRAVIKDQPYHYSIKIGGKEFVGCVELFIAKQNKQLPKLAQVYSEPECWYQLGSKGKTVDMIKGSLQLCQMLFGVIYYQFEDNSNVECGTTNHAKAPPRKLEKPFSLAHLSIAEKGKTWYETHFNAFLQDPVLRSTYRKSLTLLTDAGVKTTHDFESFAAINYLRKDQYDYIKPIYESTATWRDFFNKIPKHKQCFALFNWLPTYMDRYILNFDLRRYEWCIYMGDLGLSLESKGESKAESEPEMMRTDLFIHMSPEQIVQWGGSCRSRQQSGTRTLRRKSRHTRRQGSVLYSFSNQY